MGDAIPKIIKSTFQLKRGNSADWTSQNIVLAEGEPGFELDTGKLKIGDGIKNWNQLSYITDEINQSDPVTIPQEIELPPITLGTMSDASNETGITPSFMVEQELSNNILTELTAISPLLIF